MLKLKLNQLMCSQSPDEDTPRNMYLAVDGQDEPPERGQQAIIWFSMRNAVNT
jgi:hypothetical protein